MTLTDERRAQKNSDLSFDASRNEETQRDGGTAVEAAPMRVSHEAALAAARKDVRTAWHWVVAQTLVVLIAMVFVIVAVHAGDGGDQAPATPNYNAAAAAVTSTVPAT